MTAAQGIDVGEIVESLVDLARRDYREENPETGEFYESGGRLIVEAASLIERQAAELSMASRELDRLCRAKSRLEGELKETSPQMTPEADAIEAVARVIDAGCWEPQFPIGNSKREAAKCARANEGLARRREIALHDAKRIYAAIKPIISRQANEKMLREMQRFTRVDDEACWQLGLRAFAREHSLTIPNEEKEDART